MKIGLAASGGGHLTEAQMILTQEVVGDNEIIILTQRSSRTEKLPNKTYFFKPLGYNPIPYLPALIKCIKIFKKEKIKLMITIGAEIALPTLIAAKLLRIKTIYIDGAAAITNPSLAGKFSYPFSDIFLVQYLKMKKCYGKKAKFEGGVV